MSDQMDAIDRALTQMSQEYLRQAVDDVFPKVPVQRQRDTFNISGPVPEPEPSVQVMLW